MGTGISKSIRTIIKHRRRPKERMGVGEPKPKLHYDLLKGVAKKLMALRSSDVEGRRWRWNRTLVKSPQFKFMVSVHGSIY